MKRKILIEKIVLKLKNECDEETSLKIANSIYNMFHREVKKEAYKISKKRIKASERHLANQELYYFT